MFTKLRIFLKTNGSKNCRSTKRIRCIKGKIQPKLNEVFKNYFRKIMTEDEENFLKCLIVIYYSNNMKKEAQKIIENERNLEKRKTETRNLLLEEHERT